MAKLSEVELLFGHTSEETARVVHDYPYGRRIRTDIRYWIESNAKHGDRFVSQTLNPKTGRWNKPKKSTYTGVMVMFLDAETGYTRRFGINFNDSAERIAEFVGIVGKERLTELQVAKLVEIIGYTRAMANVTWSIRANVSAEEAKALDAEQKIQEQKLGQLISIETALAGKAMSA